MRRRLEMEIGDFFSGRWRSPNGTLTRHGNDADEDGRLSRLEGLLKGGKQKSLGLTRLGRHDDGLRYVLEEMRRVNGTIWARQCTCTSGLVKTNTYGMVGSTACKGNLETRPLQDAPQGAG